MAHEEPPHQDPHSFVNSAVFLTGVKVLSASEINLPSYHKVQGLQEGKIFPVAQWS